MCTKLAVVLIGRKSFWRWMISGSSLTVNLDGLTADPFQYEAVEQGQSRDDEVAELAAACD